MKKHIKGIFLFLVTILLISCRKNSTIDYNQNVTSNINKSLTPTMREELVTNDTPVPSVVEGFNTKETIDEEFDESLEYFPIPTADKYRDYNGSLIKNENIIEKEDYLQYINHKDGYSIDIPIYYKDYLLIHEYEDFNETEFVFYGKSAIGRGWFYFIPPSMGIYLFSIVSEEALLQNEGMFDNLGCIGTVNGVKYYAISSTDVTINVLISEVEYIKKGESYFQEDEQEKQLIISDYEMAIKLDRDMWNIINSFKVID